MALRKFIIERDNPAVGTFEREQIKGAAAQSNKVLKELGPDIQWQESYVAADKTFCVYLAKDEAIIKKHAEMSGFPATKITEVRKMIDPTTERDGASCFPPPFYGGGAERSEAEGGGCACESIASLPPPLPSRR